MEEAQGPFLVRMGQLLTSATDTTFLAGCWSPLCHCSGAHTLALGPGRGQD